VQVKHPRVRAGEVGWKGVKWEMAVTVLSRAGRYLSLAGKVSMNFMASPRSPRRA
jgi:hypothetical protein